MFGFFPSPAEKRKSKLHRDPISLQAEWLPLRKQQKPTNADENAEGKRALIHCWWKCELVQPLWKSV
jgi:hypothetical protein